MRAMLSCRDDRWKAGQDRVDVCQMEAEGLSGMYGSIRPTALADLGANVRDMMVKAIQGWLEPEPTDDDGCERPSSYMGTEEIFCPRCGGETTGSKREWVEGTCLACLDEQVQDMVIGLVKRSGPGTWDEAVSLKNLLRDSGLLRTGEEYLDASVRWDERDQERRAWENSANERGARLPLTAEEEAALERMTTRDGHVTARGQGRQRIRAHGRRNYGEGAVWMRTFASEESMDEWLEDHPDATVDASEWTRATKTLF